MKLPTCWSCGYVFKWRQLAFFIKRKICPQCQSKQYVTTQSNWRLGVVAAILPIFILISNMLNLHWILGALFMVISLLIYCSVMPFLLEFTDTDQPLF